ncbi:MAG: Uma2 family endonuclease [Gemmataceae bacterium]
MATTASMLGAPPRLLTVEQFREFVNRPENKSRRFELLHGEVHEVSRPHQLHGTILGCFTRILGNYSESHEIGSVSSGDAGVVLDAEAGTVVGPDVAFFLDGGEMDQIPARWSTVMPAVVVEILSPSNRPNEVSDKIDEYLAAGVNAVWVADPDEKSITIHVLGADPVVRVSDDPVSHPLLPGFQAKASDFFSLWGDRRRNRSS